MAPFKKQKRPGNHAFIDSQNLNMGTQKMGWKMDWRRFRHLLRDKYGVSKAYMFIGHIPEHEDLYKYMHELGYLVVLKPTQDSTKPKTDEKDKQADDKKQIKGNIDADMVLWAVKEMKNYDKAVIVTGDGDFYGLIEYLKEQGKLEKVLAPNWQYSSLLKPFDSHIVRLDQMRRELAYRDRKNKPKH